VRGARLVQSVVLRPLPYWRSFRRWSAGRAAVTRAAARTPRPEADFNAERLGCSHDLKGQISRVKYRFSCDLIGSMRVYLSLCE